MVPGDEDEGAVLRVHGMPTLDSNPSTRCGSSATARPIPQSLFSVGEDGDGAAAVSDDLEGADAVMVTREPAGGARAPSEEPILSVE